MKMAVNLVVGFLFAYLVLRLLKEAVGFPAGWPIFFILCAGLIGLFVYLDRRHPR